MIYVAFFLCLTMLFLLFFSRIRKASSFYSVIFQSELLKKRMDSEGVSNRGVSDLGTKLEEMMVVDRIYFDKDLSLFDLARKLDTNSSYLSSFINKNYKCNFTTYINLFRLREACVLLLSEEADKLSIEQIADRVGFSSRTAFYVSFKKELKCSPARFRKDGVPVAMEADFLMEK